MLASMMGGGGPAAGMSGGGMLPADMGAGMYAPDEEMGAAMPPLAGNQVAPEGMAAAAMGGAGAPSTGIFKKRRKKKGAVEGAPVEMPTAAEMMA